MVRFNIPQRLSSKLKPRILNASEIIIMQARVSLLPASVSLSRQDTVCLCVNIHSAGRMPLNFWNTVLFTISKQQFSLKGRRFSYMHIFIYTSSYPGDPPLLIKTLDKLSVCLGRGHPCALMRRWRMHSRSLFFLNTLFYGQKTTPFISTITEPGPMTFCQFIAGQDGQSHVNVLTWRSFPAAKSTNTI